MPLRLPQALLHGLFTLLLMTATGLAQADSKEKIDAQSREALKRLEEFQPGLKKVLKKAEGVLVFPDIVKMTFGGGGQFGEGSLSVDGKTMAYYATAGGEFGLKSGEIKSAVVLFMTTEALQAFRGSQGWQEGVHGEVVMMHRETGTKLKARDVRDPIVGFVFSNTKMLHDFNLQDSKMNRIAR